MTNSMIFRKGLVVGVIFLLIGVGVISATAIKSNSNTKIIQNEDNINLTETKVKPTVSPSGYDVYTDCDITSRGCKSGQALLFPGFFISGGGPINLVLASGILTNGGDGLYITGYMKIDGNTYHYDEWKIIIVMGYSGFMDNDWSLIEKYYFRLDGHAVKAIVIDKFLPN